MEQLRTLRLRPHRRYFYANAALFGSLAICAVALAVATDLFVRSEYLEERAGLAWGLVAAVALAVISGCYVLATFPTLYYLELTPEGFTERQLFLRRTRRWSDIERFWAGYDDGPYVGFRYGEGYRAGLPPWLAGLGFAMSGCMFGVYGEAADDLADLLNAWRDRYADSLRNA
jgi:hypothetical protein